MKGACSPAQPWQQRGAARLGQILTFAPSYADNAALKAHGESEEFKKFYKTLVDEDLVDGATQLKFVKPVTGFISRL